jgi:putative ABC transport system ATP-binding protein
VLTRPGTNNVNQAPSNTLLQSRPLQIAHFIPTYPPQLAVDIKSELPQNPTHQQRQASAIQHVKQDQIQSQADKELQSLRKNHVDLMKRSVSAVGSKNTDAASWQRDARRLLRIAKPEIPAMSLACILLFVSSGITMAVPFSIGKILDSATQADGLILGMTLEHFCVVFLTVIAGGAFASCGQMALLKITGERIITKLRSSLYKHTYVQNAEFFDSHRVGDLISRLGNDTTVVGKSITDNLSDGLRSLVFASSGLGMMTYISYKLVGVLAFAFPPLAAGAFLYGRAVRDLSRRIQTSLGTLTKIAEERLGNVRTSQAFAGELQEVRRYNDQTRKIFKLSKREALISATFFSTSSFLGNATFLALLYVGNVMVRSGAITIGDLTTFVMYTGVAGGSLFGFSTAYSDLMKGLGAASRLFELQDQQPTTSLTRGIPVKSARGRIQFRDVDFAYPTRPSVRIFQGLSLMIQSGSNVAIVAPSGVGKSTITSLLMRFYRPLRGAITINHIDINEMNMKQLRRRIGFVGQEPVLFSGTVAENVAYGRPEASRSEILEALRLANCHFVHEFVSATPRE